MADLHYSPQLVMSRIVEHDLNSDLIRSENNDLSPITWDISHRISIHIRPDFSHSDIAKIGFFFGLSLASILGCIVVYNTRNIILDDGMVASQEPVDGGWSEWSSWSSCSATCQSKLHIPTQIKLRTCSNPPSKNGGKHCEGGELSKRYCTLLTQCDVDRQWGEWRVAGLCESMTGKPCSLGKKLYRRECNKTALPTMESDCKGTKERTEDCWFDTGCPVGLQPPLAIEVLSNGRGSFDVRWSSVPYGVTAVKYRVFLSIEDTDNNTVETVHVNITAVPPVEVTGRRYSITVDMARYLRAGGRFVMLVVRVAACDYWDTESRMSEPVRSRVNEVDGQWGDWDHWSECSTLCISKRGRRLRTRKCDQPPPTTKGKQCSGNSTEKVSCIGMETEC